MSTAAPPAPRACAAWSAPPSTGVLVREIINFSSYWRSTTFSSTVEPTIYLLAFGFGFGSLVSEVGGYTYVEFVGTGTVATAVLFSSAFPAMFGTLVKHQYQHTYDAILAAPVDTEELVTAEMLWIAVRAGVRLRADGRRDVLRARPAAGACSPCRSSHCRGLRLGRVRDRHRRLMESFENFSYIISAVLTPLFLVAGTFFPIDELPEWAQVLAWLNPLYQLVELVRDAVFGVGGPRWTSRTSRS